jgi:hypothetical protein
VNPDRGPENLSIFSGPALEVVFHWWLESNRRWTARDVRKAPIFPTVDGGDAALGVNEYPSGL